MTAKCAFAGFAVTQLCPGHGGFEMGTDYPLAGCSSGHAVHVSGARLDPG